MTGTDLRHYRTLVIGFVALTIVRSLSAGGPGLWLAITTGSFAIVASFVHTESAHGLRSMGPVLPVFGAFLYTVFITNGPVVTVVAAGTLSFFGWFVYSQWMSSQDAA